MIFNSTRILMLLGRTWCDECGVDRVASRGDCERFLWSVVVSVLVDSGATWLLQLDAPAILSSEIDRLNRVNIPSLAWAAV
jgi:hypothetical protein